MSLFFDVTETEVLLGIYLPYTELNQNTLMQAVCTQKILSGMDPNCRTQKLTSNDI